MGQQSRGKWARRAKHVRLIADKVSQEAASFYAKRFTKQAKLQRALANQ